MFVHNCIFGISYIDYFTMCDFMTLLGDQIHNMLLDDAFFTFKNAPLASYDLSELGTMLCDFHLLIKVTLKLKDSTLVLDKHKTIIIQYPVILECIYGHFVLN